MAKAPAMTSDFQWQKPGQVRLAMLVDSVIDLITKQPRPVVNMPLADWLFVQGQPFHAVQHVTGAPNKYFPHKVPQTLQGAFPVLVGNGCGKLFLIDGAHRVARALMEGRVAIPAVILTEEETKACIRDGQKKRFDELFAPPAKPQRAGVRWGWRRNESTQEIADAHAD
jgi:hypothetical protein